MRSVLLAAAAALGVAAVPAGPAGAQSWSGDGFTARGGGHSVRHGRPPSFDHRFKGDRHRRDRHEWSDDFDRRKRHGRDDDVLFGGWGWSDGWALYNNRSFDPDSYNDWWHERPWRSYPRWLTTGSCDRWWWGGGTWRCRW